MKALTKNLLIFSAWLTAFTILFRFGLSSMLQEQLFNTVWILAIAYGVMVFIVGWIFGKRDQLHLPLYDIGFRFHLATYLICNFIAFSWHALGFQSDYENINVVGFTAIYWGTALIIHFVLFLITRKHAISGIKKTEIFE